MTKIIACGNLLRGDDGLGAHVLMELAKSGVPSGVTLIEAGACILDILLHAEKGEKLLILDAVKGGHPPGTIYRIPVNRLNDCADSSLTLHGLGPQDIRAIGRAIWGEDPCCRMIVLGMEVGSTDFAVELSPEVRESLPRLVDLVREEMADRGKE